MITGGVDLKKMQLVEYVLRSQIFQKWHWFSYHFSFYIKGKEHPFSRAIIDALLKIDIHINGYAINMVDKIASIGGQEKSLVHYEQLLQLCSEIYVILQAVNYFGNEANFEYEPPTANKKTPELIISTEELLIGVEVKQPSLIKTKHIQERQTNPLQLLIRHEFDLGQNPYTKPRDNPIKDFFISADKKFENFKGRKNFFGVLFIVWDDFINEPISAILGKPSGLFCDDSFAKDKNGCKLQFKNVNAVIIDRNLSNFLNSLADRPLLDNKKNAMDYGQFGEFPFKVIIQNPEAIQTHNEIAKCFQAHEPCSALGAEYTPMDFVQWL